MNIYILNYNNYYNRIVKKEKTISDYSPYIVLSLSGINFIPNDGINTTQIVNCNGVLSADYFIAEDEDGGFTRWFILENERIRNGQYKLTLRRDLMADYYEPIVKSPCFIERGTVDINSPFIFNSEGQSYNQIKTSETLLKDKSGCPWLVGYMARYDAEGNKTTLSGTIKASYTPDYIVNGPLEDFEYYQYLSQTKYCYYTDEFWYTITYKDTRFNYSKSMILKMPDKTAGNTLNSDVAKSLQRYDSPTQADYTKFATYADSINKYANTWFDVLTVKQANDLKNKLSGKIVQYTENGVVKAIKINEENTWHDADFTRIRKTLDNTAGGMVQAMTTALNAIDITGDVTAGDIEVTCFRENGVRFSPSVIVDYSTTTETTYFYNIQPNRGSVLDAPYDIFAIPYGDVTVKNLRKADGSLYNITVKKDTMINLMTNLAAENPGVIYDIQMLPFCPIQGIISGEGELDLINLQFTHSANYGVINKGTSQDLDTVIAVMVYPSNSAFSFNIELDEPVLITEPKIQSECDMYRLCSPNFGATFEFNAAKNGGIQYFNIDCTYMPYNPYIHINPNFSELYGQDFNDARGLICSGEFSLPKLDDAWAQYQLQNKNYQASFDRQIQNMEVKRDIALKQGIISAVTGTVTGAASGAVGGGMLGGPAGAAIGGVLGGAASGAGGIADVYYQDKLMKEDISLQKDMFAYQLGNIKAMPQSLSRTTAFTNNNKYFPVLEYYTCTEEEKEALRQKIKYRGMSVNIISTIENFIQGERTYIKGKIIRIDDISEDFNLFTQIMFEIDKGIYI